MTSYLALKSQVTVDQRLYDCFSENEINDIIQQNPKLIEYYNFYLDNSYYVVSLSESEKPVTGEDIHKVTIKSNDNVLTAYFDEKTFSKEKFNPLKYNFKLDKNRYNIYIWKEANVAIVFYPLNMISSYYKEYNNKINH
jgi:hypothetical protein